MGRYGYYSCFPRQMTKWEKAEKAAKAIARLTKKGAALSPIPEFSGRIAKTFWGKAWCDNIESYRDYAYRLERGRSYVRSGAVIDGASCCKHVASVLYGIGARLGTYQAMISQIERGKVALRDEWRKMLDEMR